MINIIFILISFFNHSMAQESHCEYFKYCGSGGAQAKSSSQSYPSTSSASGFNPSAISKIKGFGLETLLQPNNPVGFSLASGTGKFGGALISPNLENGFFGNRAIELDQTYLTRRLEKTRYKSKKLSLAIGASLVDKKNFSLDLGLAVKRHSEIKKINPGAGISLGVYNFTFGYAVYKDDVRISLSGLNPRTGTAYSSDYATSIYDEKYLVSTYSAGLKIGNLSLDYGRIHTNFKFYAPVSTNIAIFSSAFNVKNFLFNVAYRKEDSPNPYSKEGSLTYELNKTDIYFGAQYLFNKHFVFGLGYNTFLLNEISSTVTIYL